MADDTKIVGLDDRGNRVGEDHGRAKLTDHEVELIRQLRELDPPMPMREIAEKFEVSVGAICGIANYRLRATTAVRWKRVKVGGGIAMGEKAND